MMCTQEPKDYITQIAYNWHCNRVGLIIYNLNFKLLIGNTLNEVYGVLHIPIHS